MKQRHMRKTNTGEVILQTRSCLRLITHCEVTSTDKNNHTDLPSGKS